MDKINYSVQFKLKYQNIETCSNKNSQKLKKNSAEIIKKTQNTLNYQKRNLSEVSQAELKNKTQNILSVWQP